MKIKKLWISFIDNKISLLLMLHHKCSSIIEGDEQFWDNCFRRVIFSNFYILFLKTVWISKTYVSFCRVLILGSICTSYLFKKLKYLNQFPQTCFFSQLFGLPVVYKKHWTNHADWSNINKKLSITKLVKINIQELRSRGAETNMKMINNRKPSDLVNNSSYHCLPWFLTYTQSLPYHSHTN